jgi:hypothetical protein
MIGIQVILGIILRIINVVIVNYCFRKKNKINNVAINNNNIKKKPTVMNIKILIKINKTNQKSI